MREVVPTAVLTSPQLPIPGIFLQEEREEGGLGIAIWIGRAELESIVVAMQGIAAPRPNTHDLCCSILATCAARLQKVIITKMEHDTFFAELEVETPHGTATIDSRPSDAIAIAMRAKAPIYVAEEVFLKHQARITPDGMLEYIERDADAQSPEKEQQRTEVEKLLGDIDIDFGDEQ